MHRSRQDVEVQGSRTDNWQQDCEAMANGHLSGFVDHILLEDAVTQMSMGSIADRTLDFLTHTGMGVQRCRQLLLAQLEQLESGASIDGSMSSVSRSAIARGALIRSDDDWRAIQ